MSHDSLRPISAYCFTALAAIYHASESRNSRHSLSHDNTAAAFRLKFTPFSVDGHYFILLLFYLFPSGDYFYLQMIARMMISLIGGRITAAYYSPFVCRYRAFRRFFALIS